MNEADFGALKMRVLNEMQATQGNRVAGADLYMENTRQQYLMNYGRLGMSDAGSIRYLDEGGSGIARMNLDALPLNSEGEGR